MTNNIYQASHFCSLIKRVKKIEYEQKNHNRRISKSILKVSGLPHNRVDKYGKSLVIITFNNIVKYGMSQKAKKISINNYILFLFKI